MAAKFPFPHFYAKQKHTLPCNVIAACGVWLTLLNSTHSVCTLSRVATCLHHQCQEKTVAGESPVETFSFFSSPPLPAAPYPGGERWGEWEGAGEQRTEVVMKGVGRWGGGGGKGGGGGGKEGWREERW